MTSALAGCGVIPPQHTTASEKPSRPNLDLIFNDPVVLASRLIAVVRAADDGVRPLLPLECMSEPLARSSAATSVLLQLTARRRGVSPRLSRTSIPAPQSNKASATST